MTPEQMSALLTSVAALLGAILWPVLVFVLVITFKSEFRKLLKSDDVTFKAAGLEASFQRKRVEAAVALGAATAKSAAGQTPEAATSPALLADALAQALPDERTQRLLQGSVVLWVDDRPENNVYERQALEALEVTIDLAKSTEQALALVRRQSYNLIISDMGRPPDNRAGYTLLDKLRASGDHTPFLIYAGSRRPEHIQEARDHGALGATNRPQELILMAVAALGSHPTKEYGWGSPDGRK
ncbi:CheY-like chemotaxis protein [Pseudarthrobacter siccitolerans]|uniref:CheY-like chemotaxis protein n=1 Tax=Pseudarthrobacter siccitolerans TaxID=861266 RepID=A0ABU0PQU9_9MICC|nr:response regulator [Pseudarthrobacter siccitolerans]MDQ0676087.1 CheY-like chemotaxis protein [Pseudarthrobacter siccitolerans]